MELKMLVVLILAILALLLILYFMMGLDFSILDRIF
jgi:hypothetical protein